MTAHLFPPRPHVAPSPLQHYLLQRQQTISDEVGISILLQVSAGYGPNYTVVLMTFEGDEATARGDDLDEALTEATQMLIGLRQAQAETAWYMAQRQKRLEENT